MLRRRNRLGREAVWAFGSALVRTVVSVRENQKAQTLLLITPSGTLPAFHHLSYPFISLRTDLIASSSSFGVGGGGASSFH